MPDPSAPYLTVVGWTSLLNNVGPGTDLRFRRRMLALCLEVATPMNESYLRGLSLTSEASSPLPLVADTLMMVGHYLETGSTFPSVYLLGDVVGTRVLVEAALEAREAYLPAAVQFAADLVLKKDLFSKTLMQATNAYHHVAYQGALTVAMEEYLSRLVMLGDPDQVDPHHVLEQARWHHLTLSQEEVYYQLVLDSPRDLQELPDLARMASNLAG